MNQWLSIVLLVNLFTFNKTIFAEESPIYTPDCQLKGLIKQTNPSPEWYIKKVPLFKECGDKPFLVGFQKEEGNTYRIQFCRPKGSRIANNLKKEFVYYNAETVNLKYFKKADSGKWTLERFNKDFKSEFKPKLNSSKVAPPNSIKTIMEDKGKKIAIFTLGQGDATFFMGTKVNGKIKRISDDSCEFNIVRDLKNENIFSFFSHEDEMFKEDGLGQQQIPLKINEKDIPKRINPENVMPNSNEDNDKSENGSK